MSTCLADFQMFFLKDETQKRNRNPERQTRGRQNHLDDGTIKGS